jgi:dTDP-4-amino-4,6-dideoxygalactose transaminase
MQVPFVDLKRDTADVAGQVLAAVTSVIESARFILGPEVQEFEREFARYCEVGHGIGVGNGTDALVLAGRALDLTDGCGVIVPANTFIATFDAIARNGAVPVPVDPDPDFYTIDGPAVEARMNAGVRAVIPVHLFGQVAEMNSLVSLCSERGIPLIEDSAQAHGARYEGRRAGSFGRCACFSFYPSKNLGALGDGGIVVTGDEELEARVRMLRDYGQKRKNEHLEIGFNSRLDTIQAAALLVKLKVLDAHNEKRARAAVLYGERLVDLEQVSAPLVREGSTHVYHVYSLRCERRDELRAFLQEKGVSTGLHYPVPPHMQQAYAHLGYGKGDFPVSERLAGELLSLPMFPSITTDEVDYVCESIRGFYGKA